MKVMVIYDTQYGYTEKVAQAIAGSIVLPDEVRILRVSEVKPGDLETCDLIIVGSPTQGGRPTKPFSEFLAGIPANALANKGVTAFDTRLQAKEQNAAVRFLLKTVGYAAGRIADALVNKGGKLAVPAEGFIVEGREGPLRQGELERAAGWGKTITQSWR